MSATTIWSHTDGQAPQEAGTGYTLANEVYNFLILPMGAIMSLSTSSIVLQRVRGIMRGKRPLGFGARTTTAIGADRLYTSLVSHVYSGDNTILEHETYLISTIMMIR